MGTTRRDKTNPEASRRSPGFEHSRARLELLYEVSKLLTRFEAADRTVPGVIELIARALPLCTAVFVVKAPSGVRTLEWHAGGVSPTAVESAVTNAVTAYEYLVSPSASASGTRATSMPRERENLIVLPLVIEHRPIFGVLQLEGAVRLDESDLMFANAIVNQLALALSWQASIAATQAAENEASERFRLLAESVPHKIFVARPNGEAEYVNPQWTGFTWFSFTNVRDWTWSRFVHPDDIAQTEIHWRRALETGQPFQLEHRFRHYDGTYLWHLSRAHAMRDEQGMVMRWIGSSTEIEGQKRAEAAQRVLAEVGEVVASSLDLEKTVETVARSSVPALADLCFVDVIGEDGRIDRIGPVIHELAPDLRGESAQARVLRSGAPVLVRDASAASMAALADSPDGALLRAARARSMIVVPLRSGGRTLGALTFIVGDSERSYSEADLELAEDLARRSATAIENARLYEQARAATRAREDLIAIVSHDLRNPLGVILVNLAVLSMAAGGNERRSARKQLDAIQRAADRMNVLVRDLLDMASIEAGRLTVEPESVDIGELLRDAVEASQPAAAGKALHLECRIASNVPAIAADTARLHQVLANLLDNAIKFTPAEGSIIVRAELVGDEVQCSVADSGTGIAPEERPRVFDRFWQTRRTARLGTGLGLFIVRGIVEAHGGRIWVEGTPGGGATFLFVLPVAQS